MSSFVLAPRVGFRLFLREISGFTLRLCDRDVGRQIQRGRKGGGDHFYCSNFYYAAARNGDRLGGEMRKHHKIARTKRKEAILCGGYASSPVQIRAARYFRRLCFRAQGEIWWRGSGRVQFGHSSQSLYLHYRQTVRKAMPAAATVLRFGTWRAKGTFPNRRSRP